MTSLTPNRVYAATFSNALCLLTKKNPLTLTENLLNFNRTYMGQKKPFESFLKN